MRIFREITNVRDFPEKSIAWCEANGLDANDLPADDSVRIGLLTIAYREYDRDASGRIKTAGNDVVRGPWRRTRLRAQPGAYGLKTRWVVR